MITAHDIIRARRIVGQLAGYSFVGARSVGDDFLLVYESERLLTFNQVLVWRRFSLEREERPGVAPLRLNIRFASGGSNIQTIIPHFDDQPGRVTPIIHDDLQDEIAVEILQTLGIHRPRLSEFNLDGDEIFNEWVDGEVGGPGRPRFS